MLPSSDTPSFSMKHENIHNIGYIYQCCKASCCITIWISIQYVSIEKNNHIDDYERYHREVYLGISHIYIYIYIYILVSFTHRSYQRVFTLHFDLINNELLSHSSFIPLLIWNGSLSHFVSCSMGHENVVNRVKYRITSRWRNVIMSAMASQITSLIIVCTTVCPGADQRKHPRSASLAFVWGIQRWPVNSPHKGPVTQKIFPFDDDIMQTQLLHYHMDSYSIYFYVGR